MAQKADQCIRFRDAGKSERIFSAHEAVIGVTVFELTEGDK
jgi:hypothetical protein